MATLRHSDNRDTVVYTHGNGRANHVFTDETGAVVQAPSYTTYGQDSDPIGNTDPMEVTDDLWNGGDSIPELGVVLLGPRAYDPDLGRFLQRDPIAITSRASTANPYAFGFSDPVNFADPSGLSPVDGRPRDPPVTLSGAGILAAAGIKLGVDLLAADSPGGNGSAVAVGADSVDLGWARAARSSASGGFTTCGVGCSVRNGIASQGNRIMGAARVVEGGVIFVGGYAVAHVPGLQVHGVALMAMGADQAGAGVYSMVTNEHADSLLNVAMSQVVGSENADYAELGALAGAGVASLPRELPRAVPRSVASGGEAMRPARAVPQIAKGSNREMLGQAIRHVKELKGTAAERADLFETLAGQITQRSNGAWTATRGMAAEGSHVFLGSVGEALVVNPAGQLFRGSLQTGGVGIGAGGEIRRTLCKADGAVKNACNE